jgi:hypothetical protein
MTTQATSDRDVEALLPNLAEASLADVLARQDSALTRAVRRLHQPEVADEEDNLVIAGFNNFIG